MSECDLCGKYKPSDSFRWCEECMDRAVHGDSPIRPRSGKYALIDVDELTRLRADNERLRKEIGQPPDVSDPDEVHPRGNTWHEERLGWITEVDRLQADNARMRKVEAVGKELADFTRRSPEDTATIFLLIGRLDAALAGEEIP